MSVIKRLTDVVNDQDDPDPHFANPDFQSDLAAVLAVVTIAKEHGQCSCAALTSGEGPRPIGNGRFYHFQGCDYDEFLAEALARLEQP